MKGQSNTQEIASNIIYNDSTVGSKLDSLSTDVADRVSKSNGGTFNGNVTIDKGNQSLTSMESQLVIGNNIADGTAGSSYGTIRIYGKSTVRGRIMATNLTNHRDYELPNKAGTFALTSDIPTDFVSKSSGGTFSGHIVIDKKNGTSSTEGFSQLYLGNNIPSGTANNSYGEIIIYGKGSKYIALHPGTPTDNRTITFPDKSGMIALMSDAVKAQTVSVSQIGSSISIQLTIENTNIVSGIFFSRSWSDPSNPLKGSLYWISIRPSNSTVGFYALKEETVETGVRTAIDSATYDSTTQLLTINFKGSVERFCEFIYY